MAYKIIDQESAGYRLIDGQYFSNFDAGVEFNRIKDASFPTLPLTTVVSSSRVNGQRRDVLLKVNIANIEGSRATEFFAYVFPTESGGRGPDEARIQWRPHGSWTPDLATLKPAKIFSNELLKPHPNLAGIECYIFAIYKRDAEDDDVIISAAYLPQAREYETSGDTSSSIQYKITDIQAAYLHGVSYTDKGNNQRIIHFRPKYLLWYMVNRDELHTSILTEYQALVGAVTAPPPAAAAAVPGGVGTMPRNKIIYGAPGTGKSYKLRDQLSAAGFSPQNILRVTFHPTYSYQQFVGNYKPTPIYREQTAGSGALFESDCVTKLNAPFDKEPLIDYSFVAGPLLSQFISAEKTPGENFAVVIEEINRADVSSVFGDTFQLLDRRASGDSEFEISFNADIKAYLKAQGISGEKVRFPANLYIWATMNSADQGVRPLDTAFKRRWSFEYLPLDENSGVVASKKIRFQSRAIDWNTFREKLNEILKGLGVSEDKLIGPFFLNEQELADQNAIKNKLLLYLRDDVVRHQPDRLFVRSAFSDIAAAYDRGENVFVDNDLEFPATVDSTTAATDGDESAATTGDGLTAPDTGDANSTTVQDTGPDGEAPPDNSV